MQHPISEEDQVAGFHRCGSWKGYAKWQCNFCAQDYLSVEGEPVGPIMQDHLLSVHQPQLIEAAGMKEMTVPLYGADGQMITHREVLDGENKAGRDFSPWI